MNRKMSTLSALVLTLLILVCLSTDGWGDETPTPLTRNGPWRANDMRQIDADTFIGEGPDPYVFCPPVDVPLHRVKGILWELSIADGARHFPMQLFFQTERLQWSEASSFRFTAPADGEVFIPFAANAPGRSLNEDDVLKSVRLDLEGCTACRLTIRRAVVVHHVTPALNAKIPADISYPVLPAAVSPSISDKGPWRLNGIEALAGGRHRIIADDPFIVSPDLNVPLPLVRGIYFRLRFFEPRPWHMMQLFWDGYTLGYSENRSYRFLVDGRGETADFFIPIAGGPAEDLLKTIRLDLYGTPGSLFQMVDSRVVDAVGDDLMLRVPERMMTPPGSGTRPRAILSDIYKRLTVDNLFFGMYAFLLAVVLSTMGWIWQTRPGHTVKRRKPASQDPECPKAALP